MRFLVTAAALAATAAFSAPAAAQTVTTPPVSIEARAFLIQPATLQRLQDLNFGMIVATPATSGTVTVGVDGTRSFNAVTGTLSEGVGPFGRGRFIGNGMPDQVVTLTTSFPTFLSHAAEPTRTVGFAGELDLDARDNSVTIGRTGIFYIDVGGTITIAANQLPGLYNGNVTVTANFQ